MARRELTRQQVLRWNEKWTARDCARIENALAAFPDWAYAYLPSSESYIGVMVYGDLQNHNLLEAMFWPGGSSREGWYRGLVIHRGWLEWPGGRWSDDLDKDLFPRLEEGEKDNFGYTDYYQWFPLSTLGNTGPNGPRVAEKKVVTCPTCYMAVPATGVCDFC